MASPTQWTWVWENSGRHWRTGKPGMLQFMGSQRVGHDWATELNWTYFVYYFYKIVLVLDAQNYLLKRLCCYCSVIQLVFNSLWPMDSSMPNFPVLHYLPEFAQTHVHWVNDAIWPSHPLLPPSPAVLLVFHIPDCFSQEFRAGTQSHMKPLCTIFSPQLITLFLFYRVLFLTWPLVPKPSPTGRSSR